MARSSSRPGTVEATEAIRELEGGHVPLQTSQTPEKPRPAPIRVAVVGAGFIGRGLIHRFHRDPAYATPLVVNRTAERAAQAFVDAGADTSRIVISDEPEAIRDAMANSDPAITTDPTVLGEVKGIDIVIEATGAMEHGAEVMLGALDRGQHVVSMNAEVDALLGHLLELEARANGAIYSIADGDQPGVLLRMMDEARLLGFEPVVALNCKRNLDHHQSPEDSRPYAERDGTSVSMTTSFGDGTKMQIENVVTANLSGLRPPPPGTPGIRTEIATTVIDVSESGLPDGSIHFTVGGDFGGGVMVLARPEDPPFYAQYLRNWKLGDGPLYPLFRPYHLVHMEVPATIDLVLNGGRPLGRRTAQPVADCIAVAKRDLAPGEALDGIGGGTSYGVAAPVESAAGFLLMGHSGHARMRRAVRQDVPIGLDDVDLDHEAPLVRWRQRQDRLLASQLPRS